MDVLGNLEQKVDLGVGSGNQNAEVLEDNIHHIFGNEAERGQLAMLGAAPCRTVQ